MSAPLDRFFRRLVLGADPPSRPASDTSYGRNRQAEVNSTIHWANQVADEAERRLNRRQRPEHDRRTRGDRRHRLE